MSLDCSKVQELLRIVRVQAILKPFHLSPHFARTDIQHGALANCFFVSSDQYPVLSDCFFLHSSKTWSLCVAEGIVGGDEGPVSGVAQVIGHGVKVVGAHGEEGQEEDGDLRREVKGEVEQLRDNRTCAWREDGMTDSRDLEPMWV